MYPIAAVTSLFLYSYYTRIRSNSSAKDIVHFHESTLNIAPRFITSLITSGIRQYLLWGLNSRIILDGDDFPDKPTIFVSNHNSVLDAILLSSMPYGSFSEKKPYTLCGSKNFDMIRGYLFGLGKATPVHVNDKEQVQSNNENILAIHHLLDNSSNLLIFPEGKINKELGEFKSGVAHFQQYAGQHQIVPIAHIGFEKILPLDDDENVIYSSVQSNQTVRIRFGKPFTTHGMSKEDIVEKCRNEVNSLLEQLVKANNEICQ